MSRFDRAVQGAFARLQGVAGSRVTYRRGDQSCTLVAVPALTRLAVDDGTGVISQARVQDYLIDARDLQLDGQSIQPAAGDEIQVMRMGELHVHRLMSPGGSEPVWRYSDAGQNRYRVHTKFIGIGSDA